MKVKFLSSYRSTKGNTVFRYSVSGTTEQIEAYKAAQGENFRESDDGTPLWFTTRFIGNTGTLIITTNNKIVPDMSAFEKADSLAKQFGGNLGQELAKAAAAELLGNPSGSTAEQVPANAGGLGGM